MRHFPLAILGNGPVGMLAALRAAKQHPVILLAANPPLATMETRIEAAPAGLLALLLEYGIHPQQIGVETLFHQRAISWASAQVERISTPRVAHIHRPALDIVLWQKVLSELRIQVQLGEQTFQLHAMGARANAWQADYLLDASGRTAITATHFHQARQPWVARNFSLQWRERTSASTSAQYFQLAALPNGYVYRLGSRSAQTVVFVGRDIAVKGGADALQQRLAQSNAQWLMQGLPPLREFATSPALPSSLQWAQSSRSVLLGDAALARDILGSQGLSCGLSEAILSSTLAEESARAAFLQRQTEQRRLHIKALVAQIKVNRYRDSASWADYLAFLQR